MPTLLTKSLLVSLLVCHYVSLFTPHILANTDPKSATNSATATVPASSPSTGDTTAPSVPILIRPVDGTVTGDNKIEFVWRLSTDPNGNTVIYTLYLNGVATYLGISNIGNSIGSGYTARLDGNEIKLVPTLPIPDGVYSWYVTASDPSGNTSQSASWSLVIDTLAPHILITDIDIYHDLTLDSDAPENFTNLNFDIAGPKDVYFRVDSEPYSTLTLQFFDPNNQLIAQSSWPVNSSGIIYPYQHLDTGVYRVYVSAVDPGSNTTALPEFTLTITQAQIYIPLPALPGLPPSYTIPYTPYSLPSLPATIAKIETRLNLLYLISSLLALAILVLLILVWKRRYNLILLNDQGIPLKNTIIYHSIPTSKHGQTKVWTTNRDPISYDLSESARGRVFIKHLTRYSTLTIRADSCTYILSISTPRKLYTITLG